MDKDLIKVLWVENDPKVLAEYPLEAEVYGIDLDSYDCWDDAREALLADYDSYDAIILDAKCKHHKDSLDDTTRFLSEVFSDLGGIFERKGRFLNWYVLSGEIGVDQVTPIPEKRKLWDGDWSKDHYSKTTDREQLYTRIREQVIRRSNATQIKTILYPEVFRAIETTGLGESAAAAMVSLLEPIHFPGISDADYNNRMVSARLVMEYLFRSMIDMGMIPKSYRTTSAAKDSINLTWCYKLLDGKPDPNSRTECASPERIFPRIIGENMRNIIYSVGSKVHTSATKNTSEMNIDGYLRSVGNSTNLIKSYALQLCDIILWYDGYLREHPDPKENAQNWEVF